MKQTKQVEFESKRQLKDGVGPQGVWILYGYKDIGGAEYSSFEATYPLNAPIFIEFEEVEVPSKDGKRIFLNKQLIRQIIKTKESDWTNGKPEVSPNITITAIAQAVDRIEDKLDTLLERYEAN